MTNSVTWIYEGKLVNSTARPQFTQINMHAYRTPTRAVGVTIEVDVALSQVRATFRGKTWDALADAHRCAAAVFEAMAELSPDEETIVERRPELLVSTLLDKSYQVRIDGAALEIAVTLLGKFFGPAFVEAL